MTTVTGTVRDGWGGLIPCFPRQGKFFSAAPYLGLLTSVTGLSPGRPWFVTAALQILWTQNLMLNMTMKRQHLVKAAVAAGLLLSGPMVQAQSSDALLNKLVEKGILTPKEATDLKQETEKGVATSVRHSIGLPDWVTGLKFGGDFRGRLQYATSPSSTMRSPTP